ncbi:phospholipid carrier-dependent glycosyltransferase [Catenovulum sediminis]|uniref:phospholipid carrier-dependent glycosyltransferase n=1 Tax=Catenovulum sediminis TaxID=1740262 RepID=UPI00117E590F|nr:phospholipid carrier-dependent glycosyltransferase [Catenovulum sediminis]
MSALFLRFYQLGDINKPVFDEVYFPNFAYHYIQQESFFHSHPPLAKYVMMAGMHIYHMLPWVNEPTLGSVPFNELNPVSYRWVNALLGFLSCCLFALSAYRLKKSHLFSLLVFAFVSFDGALLVASRFGLSNVHILFWGALSLYLTLLTLQKNNGYLPLLLGCSLAAVISVKWSGLSYWAITMAVLVIVVLLKSIRFKFKRFTHNNWPTIDKKGLKILSAITLVPAILYYLIWIPDLQLNTKYDFTETHRQFFTYHKNRVSEDAHPYCSKWYSWPLMQRPISYHFEKIPATDNQPRCFKNVHSFGNPVLYWMASLAMLTMLIMTIKQIAYMVKNKTFNSNQFTLLFITGGYLASWLPWSLVSRCTFLYHYQSASVFSFIALAWLLTTLLQGSKTHKYAAYTCLFILTFAFVYWLPFQLGLPLSVDGFYQRMWFKSWI